MFENYRKRKKEDIIFELNFGKKTYHRGGSLMKNILTKSKDIVSAEDAFVLYNTYGIRLDKLKLFLLSHGLDMEDEKFAELVMEQDEFFKSLKACIKR